MSEWNMYDTLSEGKHYNTVANLEHKYLLRGSVVKVCFHPSTGRLKKKKKTLPTTQIHILT